jgi:hypothetical protein
MAKVYEEIDERLRAFIEAQKVFFVATAPLASDGHVNLSPKGLDSLRVLDGRTVAWLDLTGKGIETVAHLRENGRIVLMYCSFEGPPKIVRLHVRGEVLEAGHPDFAAIASLFPDLLGRRSIIRVRVERVGDSCGYGVPVYRFEGARQQLTDWAERKGAEGVVAYRGENNVASIDGLPGLPSATRSS